MQAKIEREKILNFSFESKAQGMGTYKKMFKMMRRSPRLDAAFITTKAALTGGLVPLTRGEMQLIDTIATLNVYFEPVNTKGESTNEDGWVDEIMDQDILFALHKEWVDYQNSFYPPEPKESTGGQGDAPKPAASSEAPVQG
jgi:hypothetical protein